MSEPPSGVWVHLFDLEWRFGVMLGFERHREVVASDRRDRYGLPDDNDSLFRHINGACGELAVAKWRGCYFTPTINTFKAADIGTNVQVRTRSRHDYDLLVRPHEADDDIFVLVTGMAPHFCLRGWIKGAEGKRSEFLQDHGGRGEAYFVPAHVLHRLPQNAPPLADPCHQLKEESKHGQEKGEAGRLSVDGAIRL